MEKIEKVEKMGQNRENYSKCANIWHIFMRFSDPILNANSGWGFPILASF